MCRTSPASSSSFTYTCLAHIKYLEEKKEKREKKKRYRFLQLVRRCTKCPADSLSHHCHHHHHQLSSSPLTVLITMVFTDTEHRSWCFTPRKKEVTHSGQFVGWFIQQTVNFLVVVVENLGAVPTDAGVRGVVDKTVAAHQQHVSVEIIKLFIPSTLQKMRGKERLKRGPLSKGSWQANRNDAL